MHEHILKAMSMKKSIRTNHSNEDINIKPPAAEDLDIPNTVEAIITNRVHAIIPKREYFGRLTKKAAFRRQLLSMVENRKGGVIL